MALDTEKAACNEEDGENLWILKVELAEKMKNHMFGIRASNVRNKELEIES